MDCPVCKTERLSMMERQGIEIDYCLTCRGVWPDRGGHCPRNDDRSAGGHRRKSFLQELFD